MPDTLRPDMIRANLRTIEVVSEAKALELKTIRVGKEGNQEPGIRMVNWFKIAGVVLIVLGVLALLAGLTVVVISAEPPEDTVITAPWYVSVLGIVMIVAGVYLYYLGMKKQKKVV